MNQHLRLGLGLASACLVALGLRQALRYARQLTLIDTVGTTRMQVQVIKSAVQMYEATSNLGLPPSMQALLDDKVVAPDSIMDPWGEPWDLRCDARFCRLRSAGPDGWFDSNDDLHTELDLHPELGAPKP